VADGCRPFRAGKRPPDAVNLQFRSVGPHPRRRNRKFKAALDFKDLLVLSDSEVRREDRDIMRTSEAEHGPMHAAEN
jgi:hypothetical protein